MENISQEASHPDYRYLARICIQMDTAFHLGSGKESDLSDAGVVIDANGLPAIPGSSLAGVLRSSLERFTSMEPAKIDSLFGYEEPHTKKGQGSRLSVSWAAIHDSNNTPREGIVPSDEIKEDDVLRDALSPTVRDHLRINEYGVSAADQRSKFDELTVSAGHRFTFELELTGYAEDQADWDLLLNLLNHPLVRIGGKTRRGLGAFTVASCHSEIYDLTKRENLETWINRDQSLSILPNKAHAVELAQPGDLVCFTLDLTPEDFWMFGGASSDEADSVPINDTVIHWENDQGAVHTVFYIPGSSVKGALLHRTCFHDNRFNNRWAGQNKEKIPESLAGALATENPTIRELFGYVDIKKGKPTDVAKPGRVYIDDIYCAPGKVNSNWTESRPSTQLHNSIDRYTSGTIDGALFSDRPLAGGSFLITVFVEGELPDDSSEYKALHASLTDLAQGRLSLGAHSGRAYGYFSGELSPFGKTNTTATANH